MDLLYGRADNVLQLGLNGDNIILYIYVLYMNGTRWKITVSSKVEIIAENHTTEHNFNTQLIHSNKFSVQKRVHAAYTIFFSSLFELFKRLVQTFKINFWINTDYYFTHRNVKSTLKFSQRIWLYIAYIDDWHSSLKFSHFGGRAKYNQILWKYFSVFVTFWRAK